MPEKKKTYERVIFTPEVIKEAAGVLEATLPDEKRKLRFETLEIELSSGEEWSHDSEEEFFADYRKGFVEAMFRKTYEKADIMFHVYLSNYEQFTRVSIEMPSRADVEKVFGFLESNVEKCRLPAPPPPKHLKPKVKVFIGHGQNLQWKDLKDHLHERQGIDVEHYEMGARAGLTIKEVLDDMLTSSSFAVLVLTGEDLDAAGGLHARENVIHELGLFQGRLGWRKAIALIEEGVHEFSNIHGLNQIRFHKGNIQETYGEIIATLKREFAEEE
jgi:predicted nucleotide-binding protein